MCAGVWGLQAGEEMSKIAREEQQGHVNHHVAQAHNV